MKVLMVHNRYQQRGGEDAVVDAEVKLLSSSGVEVRRLDVDNDSINGVYAKIQASVNLFIAGSDMDKRLSIMLASFLPDIVHVHNWFPTLTPSIFRECRRKHIPVVHTLHNYRLLCVSATLFRDGHICEDCLGSALRTSGVIHKCYRESRIGSSMATASMLKEGAVGTWHRTIDKFIAPSEFTRRKLIQGGLPAEKISLKPNFIDPDPGIGAGNGGYFLYAGRLTEEKGIRTLLDCWKIGHELPLLRIVGVGPLRDVVIEAAASMHNVEWLGSQSSDHVLEIMGDAKATICPSLWYEVMPRVVIESLAVGTPVVASRIGCYPEMITDWESGVLFPPGDVYGLLSCLRKLEAKRTYAEMRVRARCRFETEYTGARNLAIALNIYREVICANSRVLFANAPVAG